MPNIFPARSVCLALALIPPSWPTLGQFRGNSGRIRPRSRLPQIGQTPTKLSASEPYFANHGFESVGRLWPNMGQFLRTCPAFFDLEPSLVELPINRPAVGQLWRIAGRSWSMSDIARSWPRSPQRQVRSNTPKLSPQSVDTRPNYAASYRCLARF